MIKLSDYWGDRDEEKSMPVAPKLEACPACGFELLNARPTFTCPDCGWDLTQRRHQP